MQCTSLFERAELMNLSILRSTNCRLALVRSCMTEIDDATKLMPRLFLEALV